MRDEPAYATLLAGMGAGEREIAHVVDAASLSARRLREARVALAPLQARAEALGATALAFGSLARREATAASDLDLALVFERDGDDAAPLVALREQISAALRPAGFEVSDKTFKEPVALGDLLRDIGGPHETNRKLTFRALTLTEGEWLLDAAGAARVRESIFAAHTAERPSRAAFTSISLFNDLYRYYRTVCLDYRWKVEEGDRPWAVRVAKLRCSRKLWHLANIATHCDALGVDDGSHDAFVATTLADPPLLRVISSLSRRGKPEIAAEIARSFDAFLGLVGDPSKRAALDALSWAARDSSPEYGEVRAIASRLQAAAAAAFETLLAAHRDQVLRFVVL